MTPMRPSAQLLVELGLAGEAIHSAPAAELVRLLTAHEQAVAAELARRHGHPTVVLSASTLDLAALGALTKEEQERLKLLPLAVTDAQLSAAVPSVEAFHEADDLSYRTGRRLKLFVVPEPLLLDTLERAHALAATGAALWVGPDSATQAPHLAIERAAADDAEAGVAALLAGLSSQLAQLRATAEAKPAAAAQKAAGNVAIPLGASRQVTPDPAAGAASTPATPRLPTGEHPQSAAAADPPRGAPPPIDDDDDDMSADATAPATEGPAAQASAPAPPAAEAERSALFDILFPADEHDEESDDPATAPPPVDAPAQPAVAVGAEAAEPRPRVIVIEDEDAIRNMMVKLLEKDGYDVVACADGRAGVEALRAGGRPDVVVTDAMLPGVHGFEICGRIKHSAWHDVPVILVSAVYKGVDHAREIQERHGADAFLEKPFPVRLLRDMVANHLGRSLDRAEPGSGAHLRLEENRRELKAATERGDLHALKSLLLERVRLNPFDGRTRAELAGCHEQRGELDLALYAYEAAAVYDEGAFDITSRLAALYGRLGFLQRARQTWGRAHLLAPDKWAKKQVEMVMAKLDAQIG